MMPTFTVCASERVAGIAIAVSSISAKPVPRIAVTPPGKAMFRPVLSRTLRSRLTRRNIFGRGEVPRTPSLHLIELFPWVLDHRDRFNLGIAELTIHLVDPAEILILHDVARFRIDHDRSARAVIFPAFQQLHRLVRVDIALLGDDDRE